MAKKPKPKTTKKKPAGPRIQAKAREKKKARVTRKQPAVKEEVTPGRPTDYREEYCEAAYRICLVGGTDDEMAERFGVVRSTIALWKEKHSEFSDAIARGKLIADAEMAHSLYQRGLGGLQKVRKAMKLKKPKEMGGKIVYEEISEYVTEEVYIPPDTPAAKHWLNNRRPEQWSEKIEIDNKDNTSLVDKLRAAKARLKAEGRDA